MLTIKPEISLSLSLSSLSQQHSRDYRESGKNILAFIYMELSYSTKQDRLQKQLQIACTNALHWLLTNERKLNEYIS